MWVIEGCRCQACVTVGNCYCGDTSPLGFKQSPAKSQQWIINTLPGTTAALLGHWKWTSTTTCGSSPVQQNYYPPFLQKMVQSERHTPQGYGPYTPPCSWQWPSLSKLRPWPTPETPHLNVVIQPYTPFPPEIGPVQFSYFTSWAIVQC